VPAGDHFAGRITITVEINRHNGVDGFAFACVVFAHPDPPSSPLVMHTSL
jgi:hypothetical protein